jgi:hypothetical protein
MGLEIRPLPAAMLAVFLQTVSVTHARDAAPVESYQVSGLSRPAEIRLCAGWLAGPGLAPGPEVSG